jgi:hypothetical protein
MNESERAMDSIGMVGAYHPPQRQMGRHQSTSSRCGTFGENTGRAVTAALRR